MSESSRNHWAELGERLRQVARDQSPTALEQYTVTSVSPLALDQIDGDESLSEDDDDVSLSDSFRAYTANYELAIGDVVRVLSHPDGWLVTEVESGREMKVTATTGDLTALMTRVRALEDANTAAVRRGILRVALTTAQTGVAANSTRVQFNSVTEDQERAWDSINFQYLPPRAGYYQVNYAIQARIGSTSNQSMFAAIFQNNAELLRGPATKPNSPLANDVWGLVGGALVRSASAGVPLDIRLQGSVALTFTAGYLTIYQVA